MAARFTIDEVLTQLMADSDSGSELEMSDDVSKYFVLTFSLCEIIEITIIYINQCLTTMGTAVLLSLTQCYVTSTLLFILNL